jgi:hypothetical protein
MEVIGDEEEENKAATSGGTHTRHRTITTLTDVTSARKMGQEGVEKNDGEIPVFVNPRSVPSMAILKHVFRPAMEIKKGSTRNNSG